MSLNQASAASTYNEVQGNVDNKYNYLKITIWNRPLRESTSKMNNKKMNNNNDKNKSVILKNERIEVVFVCSISLSYKFVV